MFSRLRPLLCAGLILACALLANRATAAGPLLVAYGEEKCRVTALVELGSGESA